MKKKVENAVLPPLCPNQSSAAPSHSIAASITLTSTMSHIHSNRSPRYIYTFSKINSNNNNFNVQKQLQEIVTSITNGLDVKNSVDPLLFDQLFDLLTEKREILKNENNISAVNSVSKAIDFINRYYAKKEKEKEHQKAREKAKMEKKRILSENMKNSKIIIKEDLNQSVDLALNQGRYEEIDPEIHSFLIEELQNIRKESLKVEDFALADRAENATRCIQSLSSENKYKEITLSRKNQIESKLVNSRTDYENLRNLWRKRLKTAENNMDHEIHLIEAETSAILKEFDEINDKPPLEKYKQSTYLLQLKQKDKYLVISKRYQEARALNLDIIRLENKERDNFVKRWEKDMEIKRNEIIKKQQEKINFKYENSMRFINDLKREMSIQLNQAKLALKHLTESVEEANVPSQKVSFSLINCSNLEPNCLQSCTSRRRRTTMGSRSRSARVFMNNQNIEQSSRCLFLKRRTINSIVYSKSNKRPPSSRPVMLEQ